MGSDERLDLKPSATESIQREQLLSISQREFTAFHAAIAEPFAPNPAMQEAMAQARTRVTRIRRAPAQPNAAQPQGLLLWCA